MPVAHLVPSTPRVGRLVIVSAIVFGEEITALEAVGYTGLLGCFTVYTYVKATETEAPPRSSEQEMKALVTSRADSKGDDDDGPEEDRSGGSEFQDNTSSWMPSFGSAGSGGASQPGFDTSDSPFASDKDGFK